ncbi:MAG TPA: TonB-dependent receptor [Terriglobales bacterium]|nr:TonB-dependent receptor [Terriglobales bacterium]
MRPILLGLLIVLACAVLWFLPLHAQSPNGTISGLVVDPTNRAIVAAEIVIVNDATGVKYLSQTNAEGIYVVPNLSPGPYRVQVSKSGFKTLIKPDVVVQVQDALAINFTLPVGAAIESVTVEGGAPLMNTESAAVSTVIDKKFVESLPLNGRSFNTLLQLTPGVVIAPSVPGSPGQFSISGQRTTANNFLVDGVSANFGVSPTLALGQSGSGAGQAFSVLGGTSSLVSVEALQEFRVETSSFAPEFGKTPGGQVLLTTRSGTNDPHGGVYEYFRNDALDANDWFANALPGRPHAPERYNNFGGYFGGPLWKNHTFFFLSYEGARLRLPQTKIIKVPSLQARSDASPEVAPFLKAYPLPNGPSSGATGVFTGVFSNSAALNAGSIRLDHRWGSKWALFSRYSDAPSVGIQRQNSLSNLYTSEVNTRTLTVGVDVLLSPRMANSLRANYSSQTSNFVTSLDSFAGAVPLPASAILNNLSSADHEAAFITYDTAYYSIGPQARNLSRQLNFSDDLTLIMGSHRIKLGGDYRALFLNSKPYRGFVEVAAPTVQSLVNTNEASLYVASGNYSQLLTHSLSLYAQDMWRASANLAVTYGLRWELSPAPAARGETRLAAWENVFDAAKISIAPPGTSIWQTRYRNFAPRIGLAYNPTHDLVLRAGAGIFYDLGMGASAQLATSYPNIAPGFVANVALPLSDAGQYLPPITFSPPFTFDVLAFDPAMKLPRSYQWNAAVEKSLAGEQTVSMTYVGQVGKSLLRQQVMYQPNPDLRADFLLTYNGAWSKYDGLQLQYRRPMSSGLQVLLNYTFAHSRDNSSNDVVAGLANTTISAAGDSASSDFDVRHSFSGALTFDMPQIRGHRVLAAIAGGWSINAVVVARTGFPFNAALYSTSPDPRGYALSRPDLVSGQSPWIANSSAPGGKSLNPAAFSVPNTTRQGTEPRNDISGFGLKQVDLSVARKIRVTDRLSTQVRVDAFNIFNHPNFANPRAILDYGSAYLSSTQMLNQGLSGLNPLFQQGGPRSLQLSLKLTF